MTMPPRLRRLALTAHVSASVGWLGAVVAFLALSITGLANDDAQTVRGAYLAMEATGWYVLVPLSLASLVTGLISALGSRWGLFRHYWVLAKLVINLFASAVLLMYMQTLDELADTARLTTPADEILHGLRIPSPVLHAGAALVLLLIATMLAVYKPRGMTRHGQRKQHERRTLGISSP